MSITAANATIRLIDKQINDLRREVPSRKERSERERDLFRQRGEAQRERDIAEYEAMVRKPIRIKPMKKCPTCGHRTLAA